MGEVTPLKTEVWKHTHKFTSRTFYPTRAASGCHAIRFCPSTSSHRRMGATLNSPTKGRVEELQLRCCDTTLNWRYPVLTGPERGFESDFCICIYAHVKIYICIHTYIYVYIQPNADSVAHNFEIISKNILSSTIGRIPWGIHNNSISTPRLDPL